MTLLATTSSSTEAEISKQGFCLSKFRMPVNAAALRMVMLMNERYSAPPFLAVSSFRKNFSIRFKSCRKVVFFLQFECEGGI